MKRERKNSPHVPLDTDFYRLFILRKVENKRDRERIRYSKE